ncbi:MAG: DUF4372 domain-containing protein [Prevotella sp.]|nr:DUF4372 domain-containing protein [Prevotella sp.]
MWWNKRVKHFTYWNLLLALLFRQLLNRESLHGTTVASETHRGKAAYLLGLDKYVARSNLIKVNQNRDFHNWGRTICLSYGRVNV